MRRTLWMVVTSALVAGWLIVSYVPGATALAPALGWPAWSLPLLRGLAILSALLFVALQIWIVAATDRALVAEAATARTFGLRRLPEAFWTAIPALSTLILLVAVRVAAHAG